MSHPHIILSKVKSQLTPIYKDFIANYMMKVKTVQAGEMTKEFIDYEDFKNMLRDLLSDAISEQEIVTLCRYFAIKTKKSPREYRELIQSIVQGEIHRGLWSDMDRLKEFIYHLSPTNVDFLNEKQMRRVIKACKIPIDDAIIAQLFEVLNRNESLEIDVQDFFSFIDLSKSKACPVPPVNPKVNLSKFMNFISQIYEFCFLEKSIPF
jgi:Ca2+-binding EF-hand superfamily protein